MAAKNGEFTEVSKIGFWMGSWYLCSLITLFSNKYILTDLGGNVQTLGVIQMLTTATMGAVKVYGPQLLSKEAKKNPKTNSKPLRPPAPHENPNFWRNMVYVGVMRGATVILGLVSLSHVAVSFTETIKASAPMFTVIFARLILGQETSNEVMLSLIPVMLGLVVCSATEWSFDMIGFLAAVSNNCIDCVQNVFSKKLLQEPSMTPVHLQFYTSVAAACLQLPVMWWAFSNGHHSAKGKVMVGDDGVEFSRPQSVWLWPVILFCAVFYHLQSVTAYYTMSLISPVSQSVANTVKRSLLIFLSILHFGNRVTTYNVLGMMTVMAGVGVYSYAKTHYPPQSSVGKDGSIVELGTVTSVIRSKSQNSFFEQQEIKLNNVLGAGQNGNTYNNNNNNIESQKSTIERTKSSDSNGVAYLNMKSDDNNSAEQKVLLV